MIKLFLGLLLLDQITKYFVPSDFLVKNFALPFGLDFGAFINNAVLVVTSLILLVYFLTERLNMKKPEYLAFGTLLAGIISNALDRLVLGYVRDFINLGIITINLADVYIVLGIAMFLYMKYQDNSNNNPKNNP